MTTPADTFNEHAYDLQMYVHDVTSIFDRRLSLEENVRLVAQCKRRLVTSGAPSPAALASQHPTAPYTRNLAHVDPEQRFVVIVLVWGGFQETTVHDHLNWCVVGVHTGTAHVTDFDRIDDESIAGRAELVIRGSAMAAAGATMALLPPSRSNIHKMTNATRSQMISIHTYGDPGTKASVFNPRSGTNEVIEMQFHNLSPNEDPKSRRFN